VSEEKTDRKSELRVALEAALYKRSKKAKDGAVHYGVRASQSSSGRWGGEAWFRDEGNEIVRVLVAGALTGDELGHALLDAVESFGRA
jgi:hypothetical protein